MSSLPDVSEYFEIFDDFLDFKIYPWEDRGYDQGVLYPERKNAIRFLNLAMNIYKESPSLLPENILGFMDEYAKPEYTPPKRTSTRKYSDLHDEIAELNNKEEEGSGDGQGSSSSMRKGSSSSSSNSSSRRQHQQQRRSPLLSKKEMQGFNMRVRQGTSTSDVVEMRGSTNKGINPRTGNERIIDTMTRSVFWDVPGEDAILSPDTFDWRVYAPAEDVARIQKEKEKEEKEKKK